MTEHTDIEQDLFNFIQSLLTNLEVEQRKTIQKITRNTVHLVSPKKNESLMCPISPEEVEKLVFDIQKGKSLGLDGFTLDFFQDWWTIIKLYV